MSKLKFNIPVRLKNPVWWVQVGGAFLLCALTYNQLQPQDLTTWQGLFNVISGVFKNPYLLATCLWSVWNASNDPTTKGITDGKNALSYKKPN